MQKRRLICDSKIVQLAEEVVAAQEVYQLLRLSLERLQSNLRHLEIRQQVAKQEQKYRWLGWWQKNYFRKFFETLQPAHHFSCSSHLHSLSTVLLFSFNLQRISFTSPASHFLSLKTLLLFICYTRHVFLLFSTSFLFPSFIFSFLSVFLPLFFALPTFQKLGQYFRFCCLVTFLKNGYAKHRFKCEQQNLS